jgi:hypothetical protein
MLSVQKPVSEIKVQFGALFAKPGGQFLLLILARNIGLGLVWHWDGQARKCFDNCYRPMSNVADNGTLIVDQQNQHN